jgi:hypothetical protein
MTVDQIIYCTGMNRKVLIIFFFFAVFPPHPADCFLFIFQVWEATQHSKKSEGLGVGIPGFVLLFS